MSFIFTDDETFEWPVEIGVPRAGTHDTVPITGHFVIIDDADFLAPNAEVTNISQEVDHQINQLMRVFKGWHEGDVLNPDETPIEPTPENIRRFLQRRPNRMAVHEAYLTAISPSKGFRAGN